MKQHEMGKFSTEAVVLLKAMANERRFQILCLLGDKELSVGELCQLLDLSQSALSQHLAWLRRDEIVSTRKEAQNVFYTLDNEKAKGVIHLLGGAK